MSLCLFLPYFKGFFDFAVHFQHITNPKFLQKNRASLFPHGLETGNGALGGARPIRALRRDLVVVFGKFGKAGQHHAVRGGKSAVRGREIEVRARSAVPDRAG